MRHGGANQRPQTVGKQIRPFAVAAEVHSGLKPFDEGAVRERHDEGTHHGRAPTRGQPPPAKRHRQNQKNARVRGRVKGQQPPRGRRRESVGGKECEQCDDCGPPDGQIAPTAPDSFSHVSEEKRALEEALRARRR